MVLPPELVGLIDYLPTWSESVRHVMLEISAMTSSRNDDKDAVLPDQEGIAWDETGIHSRYTTICERGWGSPHPRDHSFRHGSENMTSVSSEQPPAA